jgi:hypothetical protein
METRDRAERVRQHIQDGERLVTALKDLIDEQEADGSSTGATECLLRNVLINLDRMRKLHAPLE